MVVILFVQHMLMMPHVPEQKALVVMIKPVKHPEPHHPAQSLPHSLVPSPRRMQLQPLVHNLFTVTTP